MKKAQLNPRSHRSSKIGPLAFAGWAALLGLVGWGLSANAESVQSKSAAEIEAVRRQIAESRERVIAHEQQERDHASSAAWGNTDVRMASITT